ncbi:hypothetical protein R1sor_005934 [Riccia sorocarpa]|uniref:CCHC-type domain-containing protein n=1 Tax=Riccia sorocarpa TaxID=122646 RepID=A0ABD3HKZ4_9MARC
MYQDEQLQQAFTALAARPTLLPAANATRMTLVLDTARNSYDMYSKLGVILFTAEDNPSRDRVIQWARVTIQNERGFTLKLIRELTKKHFLLLLGSPEQKELLLKKPPQKMDGRAIMITSWTPQYDYKEAAKISKQVWVELPFMDPLLLQQGRKMAETLGPVLFHASQETNDVRYAHLRACVIREDTENLPNAIVVDLPWGGHYVQEVKYTRLLDTCYKCTQRGHKAFECRNNFKMDRRSRVNNRNFPASGVAAAAGLNSGLHLAQSLPTPSKGKQTAWVPKGTPQKSKPPGSSSTAEAVEAVEAAVQCTPIGQSSPWTSPNPFHVLSIELDLNTLGSTITESQLHKTDDNLEVSTQILSEVYAPDPKLEEGEILPTQVFNPECLFQHSIQVWCRPLPLPPTNALQEGGSSPTLSPLEQVIIAKRRMLFNGNTSPHEEPLEDRGRREQHKTTIRIPQGDFSALGLDFPSANLSTPTRRAVGNFIKRQENANAIVAFQELKVRDKSKLEARLAAVIPSAAVFVDYTVSGRGEAALVIPPSFSVIGHGVSGTGNVVWVTVNTIVGPLKLISVHAPNTKELRTQLWKRLDHIVGDGKSLMAGDFNMVELQYGQRTAVANLLYFLGRRLEVGSSFVQGGDWLTHTSVRRTRRVAFSLGRRIAVTGMTEPG